MNFNDVVTKILAATIKQRVPGSGPIYALARRVVAAYENEDPYVASNGEAWLIQQLFHGRRTVAFDVGANEGDWVAEALKASGDCVVYCYEPVPTTFAVLEKNIVDTRAILFNKALSSTDGILELNVVPTESTISSVIDFRKFGSDFTIEKVQIPAAAGDSEMRSLGLTHIDVLKVDVEGHDLDVLHGFNSALSEGRIDFVQFEYNLFTHLAGRALREFYDLLGSTYLLCRLLPNGLEACRFHFDLESYRQSNWVAIRRAIIDEDLTKRLRIRPARGQSPEMLGYAPKAA